MSRDVDINRQNELPGDERAAGGGLSEKLQRAAYVLGGGVKDGIGRSVSDVADHPWESALKVAGAAGVGATLALAQKSAGVWLLGGEIVGLSFAYGLSRDVIGRGGKTWDAISSSLDGTGDLRTNRKVVADTVGPFALDMGLSVLGGTLGAGSVRGASLLVESRMPQSVVLAHSDSAATPGAASPVAKPKGLEIFDVATIDSSAGQAARDLYWQVCPSVARIEVNKSTGAHSGTGFFLTERGEALTNFHVVANASQVRIRTGDGAEFRAVVTDVDPRSDLALLRTVQRVEPLQPGARVKFDPLQLSQVEAQSGTRLFAFGHPSNHTGLSMAPGSLTRLVDSSVQINNLPAPLEPGQPLFESRMGTKPGFSGGPVVNEHGEVVAIHFAGDGNGLSYSIPVRNLREMLDRRNRFNGDTSYAVPLLSKPGGLLADKTEFTSDFSGIYNTLRPGIVKIGGGRTGETGLAVSAFSAGRGGYFVTTTDALAGMDWIAMNSKGMWQTPMERIGDFDGLTLLRSRYNSDAPDLVPYISKPSSLSRGQRLVAMGFPAGSLEVHGSLGSFRGIDQVSNVNGGGPVMRSELLTEPGLIGSPVVTRAGSIVGVLKRGAREGAQIIPLDQRHPLLAELKRLNRNS